MAATDGAIMAGPQGATPPTLEGGEWTTPKANGFQNENHLVAHADDQHSVHGCCHRAHTKGLRTYESLNRRNPRETGYGKNNHATSDSEDFP